MEPRVPLRYSLLLWFAAGAAAFILALYELSGTLVAGHYVPGDPDSFYHAHRILDAVASPFSMVQFDPRIHAPEGSWVTWPWAYDMLMAWVGHIAVYGFAVRDPLSVLAYVAPLWVFVNAGLIAAAAAELRLSLPLRAVAMFCFACSPLTQELHRAGMLDHHYVEYSFVLGTLLLGLRWFGRIDSAGRAAALGVLLGAAPAFHNGLFIVQLPVLAAVALRWLLGRSLPHRSAAAFAAALMLSTLLMLLPSEPFRRLMFSFALQSWFHLLIAATTALLVWEASVLSRSVRSTALIAVSAVLPLLLIWNQVLVGGDFLSGQLVDLDQMAEVKGIFSYLREGDFHSLNDLYGGLIWLAPLGVIGLCWRLRYQADDASLYFAVISLFGAALMTQQFRLENYGSFTLYLPLLVLAEMARRRWPPRAWQIATGAFAVAAVAAVPAYAGMTTRPPLGGSVDYEMTRGIYPPLAAACASHPGVVLADNADGHFIIYHTACSVIADDFIITAQHERKLLEAQRLMQSPLDQVIAEAPYVRYLYVRRNDNVFQSNCGRDCPGNRGLRAALLFDGPPFPPQLRLIGEVDLPAPGGRAVPLARAFEIVPQN
jgi:hypothetical protein